VEREGPRLSNFFRESFGAPIIESLASLNDSIGGTVEAFKNLEFGIKRVVAEAKNLAGVEDSVTFLQQQAVFAAGAFLTINRKLKEGRENSELFTGGIEELFQTIQTESAESEVALRKALIETMEASDKVFRLSLQEGNKAINARLVVAEESFKAIENAADNSVTTAEKIAKAFRGAGKQLFDFDIGVAADKGQLTLVERQIEQLQTAAQTAAASGDVKGFDAATKQASILEKQRLAIIGRLSKAQRGASREVFEAQAALTRARAMGDRDAIQKAQDAFKDAKQAQTQVGRAGAEQLQIQDEIAKKRRELSRAGLGTPEAKALRQELEGLRRLEASISTEQDRQVDARKRIIDAVEQEADLRLKLQAQLEKKEAETLKRQLKQRQIVEEILFLDKQRREVDVKSIQNLNDPQKVADTVTSQADIFGKIAELQIELDPEGEQAIFKLEKQFQALKEAGQLRIQQLQNSAAENQLARQRERDDVAIKAARKKSREEEDGDVNRINKLKAQLEGLALQTDAFANFNNFGGDTQQTLLTGGLNTAAELLTKALENPADQQLVKSLEAVLAEVKKVSEVSLGAAEGESLSLSGQEFQKNLVALGALIEMGISDAFANTAALNAREAASLPANFDTAGLAAAAKQAEDATLSNKIANAKAAVDATAAQQVEISKQAAREAAKEKEKLEKQAADQAKISKATAGLSGAAARIAEAEARREINGEGRGGKSANQAQRERNAAFFEARRGGATPARPDPVGPGRTFFDGGPGGNIPALEPAARLHDTISPLLFFLSEVSKLPSFQAQNLPAAPTGVELPGELTGDPAGATVVVNNTFEGVTDTKEIIKQTVKGVEQAVRSGQSRLKRD
jgi:hypothetical protein